MISNPRCFGSLTGGWGHSLVPLVWMWLLGPADVPSTAPRVPAQRVGCWERDPSLPPEMESV